MLSNTAYCSNFGHFVFLSPIGTTYNVHLGLIGNCTVNFLLVLNELFRYVLQLRRYERIFVQIWHFCSNWGWLNQNFR